MDKIHISSANPIQQLEVFDLAGKLLLVNPLHNVVTTELNLEIITGSVILRATFKNGTTKKVVLVKNRQY